VLQKAPTLFARRDLPRPHAELINVPFADDHLDGWQEILTGAARSLGSQTRKLKLNY